MTHELIIEIQNANAALFRTTDKLLRDAEELRRDREALLRLLREAESTRQQQREVPPR